MGKEEGKKRRKKCEGESSEAAHERAAANSPRKMPPSLSKTKKSVEPSHSKREKTLWEKGTTKTDKVNNREGKTKDQPSALATHTRKLRGVRSLGQQLHSEQPKRKEKK